MIIDILFLLCVVYGFYLGYSKGIIKTVFTIISVVFGFMVAVRFAPPLTSFISRVFDSTNQWLFLLAFILIFVLTMLLIRLAAKGLENLFKTANINFINKIAGGVLTACLIVFVYSMLLWFVDRATLLPATSKEKSVTYTYLEAFPAEIRSFVDRLKPKAEKMWDKSVETLDKLEEKANDAEERKNNE